MSITGVQVGTNHTSSTGIDQNTRHRDRVHCSWEKSGKQRRILLSNSADRLHLTSTEGRLKIHPDATAVLLVETAKVT